MENVIKKEWYNELYGFYKPLLTLKQQEIYEYAYYEDYSLQEISEILNISRAAVFDHLQKVMTHLDHYEKSLSLVAQRKIRLKLWSLYEQTKEQSIIEEIRKLDVE